MLTLTFDARAALSDEPELAALREATLSLDVPQTPEAAEPFAAWQQAARKLADDMGATLIDDQGHAVTLHAFNAIGRELGQMYRALEARDLAAGSAVGATVVQLTGRQRSVDAPLRACASARTPRPPSGAPPPWQSKCALVAPAVIATARLCTISGASAPIMCTASTRSLASSTSSFM